MGDEEDRAAIRKHHSVLLGDVGESMQNRGGRFPS